METRERGIFIKKSSFKGGAIAKQPSEIRLRGLRVEEAIIELDRYLNHAFLAGLPSVRVIHGKGTGTLRRVVHEQLGSHPLVRSFRLADLERGAEGVTIVEMVER